jgi:hypothetical protein
VAYYYTFVDGSSALLEPPFLLRKIFLVKQSGNHRYRELDVKGKLHFLSESSGLFGFMILGIKHNLLPFGLFGLRNRDGLCFHCRIHWIYKLFIVWRSWPSNVVGIATGYGLDGPGMES